MMKGISKVLFMMIASLRYNVFAMNKLDPICTSPSTAKKMKETFFMLRSVSMGKIILKKI